MIYKVSWVISDLGRCLSSGVPVAPCNS